uniref:Receptor ligand binding region domain-containing protein n=1 Tax=Anopheles atroparvus TaxID=41427 RepID=A0A182JG13_ANOAO
MSQVKVLVLLLTWLFHRGSADSTSQVLERIAEQGFGKGFGTDNPERMDTLILWGIVDNSLVGLHQLPYPKIVFDSQSAMAENVRAGCLVFIEMKVTKRFNLFHLLNNAFADAVEHYKAKFVILVAYGEGSKGDIADVVSFFDLVSIVDYVINLFFIK